RDHHHRYQSLLQHGIQRTQLQAPDRQSLGNIRERASHTNTIDGFWSLVKRGIGGVYYQVGAEYLQSYLNEYAFRYNRRKVMRPMFSLLAERTTIQVCPCA